MDRPHPPTPPRASNIFTYILLGVVALGVLAFMYLLFGDFFVIGLAVFGLIALVGAAHYFIWGRSMTEQAKREALEKETAADEVQDLEPR